MLSWAGIPFVDEKTGLDPRVERKRRGAMLQISMLSVQPSMDKGALIA